MAEEFRRSNDSREGEPARRSIDSREGEPARRSNGPREGERKRNGANSPERKSSRRSVRMSFNLLPVAHGSRVHPTRQLFHSRSLGRG